MSIKQYGRPVNISPTPSNVGIAVSPQARVTIDSSGRIYQISSGDTDPDVTLLAVSTQKTLQSIEGTFSIVFAMRPVAGGDTWIELVDPMDMVIIELKADIHDDWSTIMVGFVDSVSVSDSIQGSTVSRSATITGEDYGKILKDSNADFWPQIDPVEVFNYKASTSSSNVTAYTEATTQSAVVGIMPQTTWYPVEEQVPGWVRISLPVGYGWVQSSDVQLHTIVDEYGKIMLGYMNQYAGTAEVTGSLTMTGLDAVLEQFTLANQHVPISMVGDPSTLMATALVTWVYQTFNPPVAYQTSGGGWARGSIASTLQFLMTTTDGFNSFSTVFSPITGSIYTWMQSIQLAPLYELWLDTRTSEEINGSLTTLCSPLSQSNKNFEGILEQYSANTKNPAQVDISKITSFPTFGADNSAPVLVYRLTPFDESVWPTLPVTKIKNQQIIKKSLQKSDTDTYNLFWVYPDMPGANNSTVIGKALPNMYYPVLDVASAVKYGLREMRNALQAVNFNNSPSFYKALNTKLYNWYRLNPTYWVGTITTAVGLPTVKVGQRVLDESSGRDYYVEGVEHDFTLFQEYETTLTLSRGRVRS